MSTVLLHRRGLRYAQQSLKIRQMYGHLWGEGISLLYFGIVLYAAARVRESVEVWEKSIRRFETAGDFWEANRARFQLAWAYYQLDDLEKTQELASQVYSSGLELGDEQALGISLDCWSLSTHGQVPVEILETELGRERIDQQARIAVLLAAAVRHFWLDEPKEALSHLDEAIAIIRGFSLRFAYAAPVYSWRATVLRTLLSHESSGTAQYRKLLKQTSRAIRAALWSGRIYRVEMPHALREAGELAVLQNQSRKARQRFNESLTEAERLGLNHQVRLASERIEVFRATGQ
jgi:two-component system sensor kinase